MKNLIVLVLLSAVLCAVNVSAQVTMGSFAIPETSTKENPVDETQLIAQYEMAFVQDIQNPQSVTEESMILKIGRKISMFYSYNRFVADSLMKVQMENNGGRIIRQRMGQGQGATSRGEVSYKIFKNYPDGKVTTLERIGPSRFLCEETNESPEWEVMPDTTTILNYVCYKAICHFKGRDYAAWFTPEIPRSEGPWKLRGLPGLILRAEDSLGHYRFECTGLFYGQSGEKIMFGADDYEPVSRKSLDKEYKRFAADPVGFITSSSPNIRIMTRDADGNPANPRNIPYNPIELSE